MQLAVSSGLPSAIEIYILEESLETMQVGELGWALGRGTLCGYSVVSFTNQRMSPQSHTLLAAKAVMKYIWGKKPNAAASIFCSAAVLKSQQGQNRQRLYNLQQFGIYDILSSIEHNYSLILKQMVKDDNLHKIQHLFIINI